MTNKYLIFIISSLLIFSSCNPKRKKETSNPAPNPINEHKADLTAEELKELKNEISLSDIEQNPKEVFMVLKGIQLGYFLAKKRSANLVLDLKEETLIKNYQKMMEELK